MMETNRKRQPFIFAKSGSNLKLGARHFSDGGRSSMVEPQIVVLVVAGSSPVGHPHRFAISRFAIAEFCLWIGLFEL
jgi:hypothetical protein